MLCGVRFDLKKSNNMHIQSKKTQYSISGVKGNIVVHSDVTKLDDKDIREYIMIQEEKKKLD